jgi:hypothetical protein
MRIVIKYLMRAKREGKGTPKLERAPRRVLGRRGRE